MRIKDLHVDGFGIWKGLKVEQLSDNFTLFYGRNEAGKTTLMQFIRSLMFGFADERREKYVPPVYGGLAGGTADIICKSGSYEIQRHVDPNRIHDTCGDLTVTDERDGSVHGRAKLVEILCEVDEPIFNNVFAIGLREIQELNALNSTEASDLLYKLTSGVDRVSLVDVMRDLKIRREALWNDNSRQPGHWQSLINRRNTLLREIDGLIAHSKRWTHVAAQAKEVSREIEELQLRLVAHERESRLLEIAIQISERWKSRVILNEQIKSFGNLPDPRDISVSQLDAINQKIVVQGERRDQILQQRRKIKQEAASLPINRSLWAQKSRVEALTEHAPWVESLQRQADKLRHEIDGIENSLLGDIDGLGNQLQIRTKDVRDLGNRGFSTLKLTGKKLSDQQDRLKRIKSEIEKAEFDLSQQQDRLNVSLSNQGSDTLEETNRYVNRLRRRIELDAKVNKLQNSRHELERDIDNIVSDQVLPAGKLGIIGLVFIGGIVLIGLGLTNFFNNTVFGETTVELGVLLMLMGAVCGFISMGLKYHWEKVARDELDDFRHQMELIRQQLRRATVERDEIERQLPDSIVQWELELKDAESRLAQLEEMVPLEHRFQHSRSGLEELKRRLANQQRDAETAQEQWRAALRTVGLPETLKPIQLKEISQRSHRIGLSNYRLDQFKSELQDRQRELDTLRGRIEGMFQDCGLTRKSADLMEQLHELTKAINEQRSTVNARRDLISKYKSLQSKLSKCKRERDRLLGQKQKLLAAAGADSEDQYRQFELKHNQREKLIDKRTNLTEQIAAALGNNFIESDLDTLLEAYGLAGLEKRWEEIGAQIEIIKAQQSKLHQQRGEFLQEVKMLGEDARLDEARLELNCLDAEMNRAARQWQILGTSSQMLESIREKFEAKRQPESLKEASTYLERLSHGQYKRIWTRLIGEELLVDNAQGETITVDLLSRGTREAVYLSLRLALIGAYARRGAVLPMVLDDVLVNFDAKRAQAAAELLCEFARNGYQLLMFTCHDHMRDLFAALGVDVKLLPHHKDVVDHQAVPTNYRNGPITAKLPVHAEPARPNPLPAAEIDLDPDDYDPELEFELSAVVSDQQLERRLRDELIYVAPAQAATLNLPTHNEIWDTMAAVG